MRYSGHSAFILGFHGCDRAIGEQLLAGKHRLAISTNSYDWLGHGIYFWENDPLRAEEWAEERMTRPESRVREPFVVGAIIDLGLCLSLMQREHIQIVEEAYGLLKSAFGKAGRPLPENKGGPDKYKRHLDCEVIEMAHKLRKRNDLRPFDSVRGLFQEGDTPYPDAGFRRKNHIQVCVRNLNCIKGYFKPLG